MFNKVVWHPIWSSAVNLPNSLLGTTDILVRFEIPQYNTGGINLWNTTPVLKTKLNISKDFTLNWKPIQSTIGVFINEQSVEFELLPDLKTIRVLSNTNGFLYVTYIPINTLVRSSETINNPNSITIHPQYPLFRHMLSQMQTEVNRMQEYIDVSPTVWRGGQDNKTFGSDPIVKKHTVILLEDLVDILQSLPPIINKAETLSGQPISITNKIDETLDTPIFNHFHLRETRIYISQVQDEMIRVGL